MIFIIISCCIVDYCIPPEEIRGVYLVGYDEEAYPKDLSGVETLIKNTIKNRISEFKSKISSRLKKDSSYSDNTFHSSDALKKVTENI